MAEFFPTTGVSYQLEEIIKSARERLFIISPYLRFNELVKALLQETNLLKIDVRVVYGKSELQPAEKTWLDSMTSIRTSFCKNLHAKCYLNENQALLTSMNLYEYSQNTNYEMGLLVSREKEPELYDKIYDESKRIMRMSKDIPVAVATVATAEDSPQRTPKSGKDSNRSGGESKYGWPPIPKTPPGRPRNGFCLRCRDSLAPNPAAPYCRPCYAIWRQYENPEYEEEYCHTCGREYPSTLLKPLCSSCYKKYKDVLEFAVF